MLILVALKPAGIKSQALGMTNYRAVAHLGMVGGGWTESKKS
jgi:hypothetical protein